MSLNYRDNIRNIIKRRCYSISCGVKQKQAHTYQEKKGYHIITKQFRNQAGMINNIKNKLLQKKINMLLNNYTTKLLLKITDTYTYTCMQSPSQTKKWNTSLNNKNQTNTRPPILLREALWLQYTAQLPLST